MSRTTLALLVLLLCSALPSMSTAQVSLRDSSVTWQTYAHTLNANQTLATYSLDPTQLIEHTFSTLILENEFLKVTLLPEYGGRIISMIYKPTGHEQLYQNPVGSPYGWWWTGTFYYNWLMIYGGIFPTLPEPEHGKSWFLPWDAEILQNTADTVRVKMSWQDDVAFTQFSRYGQTEIAADFIVTLARGRAALDVEVVLHNNAATNQRYEYWTNASMAPGSDGDLYAAKATAGAELIIPAEKLKIPAWATGITSIEQRVPGEPNTYRFDKLRLYKNWEGSGSAFSRPALTKNYWGVINHDNEEGLIRVADNTQTPYVKIWTFGFPLSTTIDPFNPPPAADNASDLYFSRPFIELWAGVSPEFNVPAMLPALSSKRWTETYIPTVGLTNVTQASETVVAHYRFDEAHVTTLALDLFATTPQANLTVTIATTGSAPIMLLDSTIVADAASGNQLRLDLAGANQVQAGDELQYTIAEATGSTLLTGSVIMPLITAAEAVAELPTKIALHQNYPNPFNPTTTITYSLAQPEVARLTVFDVMGRTVAELVNGYQQAGEHRVPFDASTLSSGVYFYRLDVAAYSETRSMFLMK